ncbi:hypothetical protein THRCLA_08083 [Thraustotheca clavata]|uniref:Uncharacterized protein n=1 Tax=Thraustotheca clavata TaxID=74557 RepID=A0A1V9ZA39_9STRA|nr:hypothetical protein THRCLA_08083 [Thraustotheca clavata]
MRVVLPRMLVGMRFIIWYLLSINSILGPLKTFYGYYLSTDSNDMAAYLKAPRNAISTDLILIATLNFLFSETTKLCKEFGGYFINNLTSNFQQILITNVSDALNPSLISFALDDANYGNTAGTWSARSTKSAHKNTITRNGSFSCGVGYIPIYVTKRGMSNFQGFRWTGKYIYHFVNSIKNLFGVYTIVCPLLTIIFSAIWRTTTHTSGIISYILSSPFPASGVVVNTTTNLQRRIAWSQLNEADTTTSTLFEVLQQYTFRIVPDVAKQITRSKVSGLHGLVGLTYGKYHVVGFMEWVL